MEIEKEDIMEIAQTNNGYILQEYFWEDSNEDGNKISLDFAKKIIDCDFEVLARYRL